MCSSLNAGGGAWGASASLTGGTRAPLLGGGLDDLMAVLKADQTEKRNAREAGLSVEEKVASRKATREAGGLSRTNTSTRIDLRP